MANNPDESEIKLVLEVEGEQFKCFASPDDRIIDIVDALWNFEDAPLNGKRPKGSVVLVDLVVPRNPGKTESVDTHLTLFEASIFKEAYLKVRFKRSRSKPKVSQNPLPNTEPPADNGERQPSDEDYDRIADKMIEKLQFKNCIHPVFGVYDGTVDENYCFVIMSFRSKVLDQVYENHVKRVMESLGFEVKRDDEISEINVIVQGIWTQLNRAGLVIADLTDNNPNVLYELGICHAMGKKVVLLAQRAQEIPFNLRHWRAIVYSPTPRGCSLLEEELASVVKTIKPASELK